MAKAKAVEKTNTVHKKRKGVHSKNASKGQNGFKQKYKGQGR